MSLTTTHAPRLATLNRTTLQAGAKHAANHISAALADLAHITLDLANRRLQKNDIELCDLALSQLLDARAALNLALKAMRHTERHLAACIGHELVPSQLDQIRGIVREARLSDSEARRMIIELITAHDLYGCAPAEEEG